MPIDLGRAASAFVNSYTQARQYKDQQKMMKHQIILQALYHQLGDENIPYSSRAKIIDSIPGLLNIKMDIPLSQQMGLQDLLDDEIETQSEIKSTPAKKGTPAGVESDAVATLSGLADTISQQATQDVPAGIGRGRVTEKMGDLSPARYKQLITSRQQDIDSEKALEQYRRKAEIDFELQQESYKAQGYNKPVTEGFNNKGEYVVLMANASGDVKEVKMPKGFAPTKILARNNSTLPAPVRAYQAYFETQLNPLTGEKYNSQEAQAAALEYYKQNGDVMFGLTKAQREATTTGTNLRNTGTLPPSPAEQAAIDDRRAAADERKDTLITAQTGVLRDAQSRAAAAQENLTSAEAAFNTATQNLNSWIAANGNEENKEGWFGGVSHPPNDGHAKINVNGKVYHIDEDNAADEEYTTLNKEVDRTRGEVNKWRNERSRAIGDAKSAEEIINKTQSRRANSGSSNITISQSQIDTFRRNNANNAKVRNMTDDEIRQVLMQNRNKWQP